MDRAMDRRETLIIFERASEVFATQCSIDVGLKIALIVPKARRSRKIQRLNLSNGQLINRSTEPSRNRVQRNQRFQIQPWAYDVEFIAFDQHFGYQRAGVVGA
jgi:hypothetical protein